MQYTNPQDNDTCKYYFYTIINLTYFFRLITHIHSVSIKVHTPYTHLMPVKYKIVQPRVSEVRDVKFRPEIFHTDIHSGIASVSGSGSGIAGAGTREGAS